MINRLVELNMQGFRLFRDPVSVPLDADVVLIYGPNGSGKSSLVQAIEFSITGKVSSLESFADDYPGCLRNGSADECAATIRCRTDKGEVSQKYVVENDGRVSSPQLEFSATDRQLFTERCLLSQVTLGRLFEIYQTKNSTDEQPLVSFIRELLKLERLDQLTGGLELVSQTPTTRKQVPAYAQLEEDIKSERQKNNSLRDEFAALPSMEELLASAAENVRQQMGDSLPLQDSLALDTESFGRVIDQLDKLITEFGESLTENRKQLQQVRELLAQAQEALTILKSAGDPGKLSALKDDLEKLPPQLTNDDSEIRRWLNNVVLADEIPAALGDVANEYVALTPSDEGTDRSVEVVRRWNFLLAQQRELFSSWRDDRSGSLDMLAQQAKVLAMQLGKSETDLTVTQLALQKSVAADAAASVARNWAKTLAEVLQKKDKNLGETADDCPVCERDYSELKQGALSDRLREQIVSLNANLEELESDAQRRNDLQTKQDELTAEKKRLANKLTKTAASLKESKQLQTRMKSLDEEFNGVEPAIGRAIELLKHEELLRTQLTEFVTQQQRMTNARQQLIDLCDSLDLDAAKLSGDDETLVALFENAVQDRLETATDNDKIHQTTLDFVDRLRHAWNRRKELVDLSGQIAQKLERLEQAKTSIDDEIKRVRKFRDVANRVKKDVIEEVFNESLNRLWGQLFGRLVKAEPFRLSLSELKIVARKLKVHFEASSDGNRFGQPGAVLSSGNLNTAALSLFLTLNLIEQSRHDILVLDDPVQNMDDMHVVHLAEVLRSVARESGRQIIIAVHERPLFEYLSLELAPTHFSHSLMTLELERSAQSFLSKIAPKQYEWQPDNLAFG